MTVPQSAIPKQEFAWRVSTQPLLLYCTKPCLNKHRFSTILNVSCHACKMQQACANLTSCRIHACVQKPSPAHSRLPLTHYTHVHHPGHA